MKRIIAFIMACLIPLQASAVYECNVKIGNILIYADGLVNVLHTGRGDYTVICSLSVERGGVSPTTCAMWTGMLQAIKKKNGLATFYFGGEGSCAAMPTYGSSPIPIYVGDLTP